jgi:Trk-type K+ transport system membrane component
VFEEQPRLVAIPWFSLYQVVSAFSNTGMSLVDQSLLPFQEAYLMNFGPCSVLEFLRRELTSLVIFFLIFAGNTAFVSYSWSLIESC